MRAVLAVTSLLLAGCATGPGPATNGSGNVTVNGDLIIVKVFGQCVKASSGFQTQSEAQAQGGGTVGVDPAARTAEVGGNAASVFAGTLGALDECNTGADEAADGDESTEENGGADPDGG